MSEVLYGPNGEYLGMMGSIRGLSRDKYEQIRQDEIDERMEKLAGGFDFKNRGGFRSQLNSAFQLAGARPIMETLDRGMDDRSDEIGKVGETIPATTGSFINPDDGLSLPRSVEQKPPAPLTGTTSEGVMANFQPDPQRDSAQNLLDQTVANVEPDKGSTATPTPDQQRDASVQELSTMAASAPSSGEMASPIKMAGETNLESLQPTTTSTQSSSSSFNATNESSSFSQVNNEEPQFDYNYSQYGTDSPNFDYSYSNQNPENNFFQEYTGIPQEAPQPNYKATFPEYMNEYSPQQMGNFANFESNMPSYSQDNEYQYYEPYDTSSEYQAQQMGDFGSYDMSNFMDFNKVPQSQNNFSEAGNFFANANAQMENAAAQETKADKRIRLAGQMGTAGKRI